MSLVPRESQKTFNLLSIGKPGVGKTTFLVGSYSDVQFKLQSNQRREHWIECQDTQVQDLEKLLTYVTQTGQYPPATVKTTYFNFSLKRQNVWSQETLCHFRWWDIPGEICNHRSSCDFQKLILRSHGCCVFIDTPALISDTNYATEVTRQVIAIASLASRWSLKYPFTLIFTKCDLIQLGPLSQLQMEENLQQLIVALESFKTNYRRFYSAISIVSYQGNFNIKANGAAAALLWIALELRKIYSSSLPLELGRGSVKTSISSNKKLIIENKGKLWLQIINYKYVSPLVVVSFCLVGIFFAIYLGFTMMPATPKKAFNELQFYHLIDRMLTTLV